MKLIMKTNILSPQLTHSSCLLSLIVWQHGYNTCSFRIYVPEFEGCIFQVSHVKVSCWCEDED